MVIDILVGECVLCYYCWGGVVVVLMGDCYLWIGVLYMCCFVEFCLL